MSNPAAVSLGRIGAMVLMANGFWPASALPMPLPAIPSVEQIGESIITEARKLMNRREAKHPAETDVARVRSQMAIAQSAPTCRRLSHRSIGRVQGASFPSETCARTSL